MVVTNFLILSVEMALVIGCKTSSLYKLAEYTEKQCEMNGVIDRSETKIYFTRCKIIELDVTNCTRRLWKS
jgi:hypothetical protein